MKKIYFATNNPNKLEEVRIKVKDMVDVRPLSDLEFEGDIPETSNTLEGNAVQKAQFIAGKYGVDCFADDTGLEVDALDGRPGVYSARYAGSDCTADDNITKLLGELKGRDDRSARFRTVVALILDGEEYLFEGSVDGEILKERTGQGGFGYDPVFRPKGFDKSFAEMDIELKNRISHRGLAIDKFVEFLRVST